MLEAELSENCNRIEALLMQIMVMPEGLFQTGELLQTLIDSLLTGPRPSGRPFVSKGHSVIRVPARRFSSVAAISFYLLTRCKLLPQTKPVDLEVRPSSTREGTKDPADVASLDVDSNFISKPSLFELVRVPFLVKGSWFLYWAVRPIDS